MPRSIHNILSLSLLIALFACTTTEIYADGFCGTMASFRSPKAFSVGINPVSAAGGDFNSDGKPDLVVANEGSNNVSVLMNNGAGGYAAASNFPTGTKPDSIAVGYFNADAKLDLATANYSTNNVSILIGDGTGGFGAPSNFAAGTNPISLAVGDFNGDWKSDLAVANSGSQNVSILLGDGAGNFAAPKNFAVGPGNNPSPRSIAVADFNGDGKPDVVTANYGTGAVSILLGDGTGNLSTASDFFAGFNAQSVTVGDLNQDGKPDLAVGVGVRSVAILLGDGAGGFPTRNTFDTNYEGVIPYSIAVGDFNGDGKPDLAAPSNLMLGDGTGNFTLVPSSSIPTQGRALVALDFNGDNKLDLAAAKYLSHTISLALGDGAGGLAAPTSVITSGFNPTEVVTADFNADGYLDLAVPDEFRGKVSIMLAGGAGGFRVTSDHNVGGGAVSLDMGDLNGDGKLDLVVGNTFDGDLTVLYGNFNGTFRYAGNIYPYGLIESAAIADFNNDGKADMALADQTSQGVALLTGGSAGPPWTPSSTTFFSLGGQRPYHIIARDFNADGKPDVATANLSANQVSILLNNGSGGFTAPANFVAGTEPFDLESADFNADGKPDLVVANHTSQNISLLLGNGAGGFAAPTNFAVGMDVRHLSVNDFNGDGNPDIAVVSYTNQAVTVLLGDGAGGFRPPASYAIPGIARSVATGDFNGDGKPDMAVAGVGISVLFNTCEADSAPLPTLSINDRSATEGNTTETFTVSLSAASSQVVEVAYQTKDGTATSPDDYTPASGTLTFNPGETSKTISVAVKGDSVNEQSETFSVILSSATNASVLDGLGIGTITNDDPPPTFSINGGSINEGSSGTTNASVTISFSPPTARIVTVDFATVDGTAHAGSDYVASSGKLIFNPGETSKTIYIPVMGDLLNEDDEAFTVNFSNLSYGLLINSQAGVSIHNDDPRPTLSVNSPNIIEGNSGTKNVDFNVNLSAASALVVSVTYATTSGTAASPADFTSTSGTLTFQPGETSKTVSVPVNGDVLAETDETFTFSLSNPTNATVATGTGTATILNDDVPGTVQFSDPAYSFNEAAGTVSIPVTRTGGASGTITVNYTTGNGTATAGQDYTANSGILTFADGETSKALTLVINNDNLFEGNETVNLTLSNPTGGATIGAQGTAILSISDDEPAPSLSISDVNMREGNAGTANLNFNVGLSIASSQAVTVAFATANGTASLDSDFQSVSGTLTFNPGETSQVITVAVNGDLIVEPDETLFVNLTSPSGASLTDAQGVGTIINDDSLGTLQLSAANYSVREDAGGVEIIVNRAGNSAGIATVEYATTNGSAQGGADYTAVTGTLTFNDGETSKSFRVPVLDDSSNEENETVNLSLTNPAGNAGLGTQSGAVLTILNDDTPTLQFSQANYSIAEGAGFLNIIVTRAGDKSAPASVKYSTSDSTDVNFQCNPNTPGQITGSASRKCDYHIAVGTLRFAAGEDTKQIAISLVDDSYVEAQESFTLTLSNSVGGTLGQNSSVPISINDDDDPGKRNPVEQTSFFVHQLYVDLLSREPDGGSLTAWTNRIDRCGMAGEAPPPCDRVTVAGDGFMGSAEFFERQFFVLRLYRTGLGRIPVYNEVGDIAYVSGFLTPAELELNKQDLVAELMGRPEFSNRYAGLSNDAYVNLLLQTAGVAVPEDVKQGWIASLGGAKTRGQVFREISERGEVSSKYLNEARVVSAYYGFFTRNPDGAYLNYLQRLDSGEINLSDLANAFINAQEYRQRFGQ